MIKFSGGPPKIMFEVAAYATAVTVEPQSASDAAVVAEAQRPGRIASCMKSRVRKATLPAIDSGVWGAVSRP
jgi:hypothetical protein